MTDEMMALRGLMEKSPSVSPSGANVCFHWNRSRLPSPYFLTTPDTEASGRQASPTMRRLSASLKLRRLPEPLERPEGI